MNMEKIAEELDEEGLTLLENEGNVRQQAN